MPKVTDIKAYWRDLASKSGLSDDEMKSVVAVLDNEKFAKTFTEGFKPLPDYSHDLDDVRTKTAQQKEAEYRDWYTKTKAQYDQYLASNEEYKRLKELYGEQNGNPNSNSSDNHVGPSKEDLEKLFETKLTDALSRRDQAYLDYTEIREQHMSTFKKPLDRAAFEAEYQKHPEWGSLRQAYKSYIEPEMEKVREADIENRIKAAKEEAYRDGLSRKSMPNDSRPNSFSPMFDRKEDVSKMTESEQDKHSRESFFSGFRDAVKAG